MDDWVSINVIDGSHDAVLEFLFGSHADVAQNGAGELREEAFFADFDIEILRSVSRRRAALPKPHLGDAAGGAGSRGTPGARN